MKDIVIKYCASNIHIREQQMCWRSQNHGVVEAGSQLWSLCSFLCLNGISDVLVCACRLLPCQWAGSSLGRRDRGGAAWDAESSAVPRMILASFQLYFAGSTSLIHYFLQTVLVID